MNNIFCNDELIEKVLIELKNDLEENQIFISEADFQFSFAKKLYEMQVRNEIIAGNKISNIILEYPIATADLYDNLANSKRKKAIDLFFKLGNTYYFIEFKYKLDKIDKLVGRYNDELCNKFSIKTQGADDNGRYSVYEDIERLEKVKKYTTNKNISKCKCFVIFITNRDNYWNLNQSKDRLAHNMPLATEDKNNKREYTKNGELDYISKKNNLKVRQTLYLKHKYKLHWNDFKTLEGKNKKFKCLVIDLNEKIVD